jgi:CxxC motif-containing protein
MGCELTVTKKGESDWAVSGWQCKIGERYGREEMTNPTRNVTTSVPVTGGDMPLVSVKTARPVPKDAVKECARAARRLFIAAPVHTGDVVLANAAGTGVDMVATRTVEKIGS